MYIKNYILCIKIEFLHLKPRDSFNTFDSFQKKQRTFFWETMKRFLKKKIITKGTIIIYSMGSIIPVFFMILSIFSVSLFLYSTFIFIMHRLAFNSLKYLSILFNVYLFQMDATSKKVMLATPTLNLLFFYFQKYTHKMCMKRK